MENEFKIRCSAIGQIMTNGRSGDGLSQTAKSYCENWVKEKIYSKKKEFSNKYTEKGISVEDDAIEFLGDFRGKFYIKNETHFENEFITGTPDIVTENSIIDIKSSWDCFTFPLFEAEPEKSYWWQVHGYMLLTGKIRAEVVHVLMDTEDGDDEASYALVPKKYRVKSFAIDMDESVDDKIRERVIKCREYISNLI